MGQFKYDNPWSAENSMWQSPKRSNYFAVDSGKKLFKLLWANYPSKSIVHKDMDDKDAFSNHCAINVSHSIVKSGFKLEKFGGVKCYHKCPLGDNNHAIRAKELAIWLEKHPFDKRIKKTKYFIGENFEKGILGKKGIVFFENYWQRLGESGTTRTGDHIDLWNKNELASIGYFATWLRRTFPEVSEDYLDMSDLRKSKQVLFWEIV